MHLAAEACAALGAQADLDGLEGLDAHDRAGQARIEPFVPLHAGAQARRHAEDVGLDPAAHGVLLDLRLVDAIDDARGGLGAGAIDLAGVARGAQRGKVGGGDLRGAARIDRAAHEAEDLDAELAQQAAGQRAGGDACGGLAGAGALERAAAVGGQPLDAAGQVGVARARTRDGRRLRGVVKAVVLVGDLQRDGRAERDAGARTGQHADAVGLDALATSAAVAPLPARELGIDQVRVDPQPGGQPFHQRQERGAVGLACRAVREHARRIGAAR